jgi:hypothetical protein
MCNYLWNGQDHNIRSRVRWIDCCVKKMIGGLNIINPEEALNVLFEQMGSHDVWTRVLQF